MWVADEYDGYWDWDHDAVDELFAGKTADPNHASRTWAVVLTYLMTDHRYLYL